MYDASMRLLPPALTVILLLLAGCNLEQSPASVAPTPTMAYIRIVQDAPPSATRELRPVASPSPTETPVSVPAVQYRCDLPQDAAMIAHQVVANVDYATRSAGVAQRTRYVNRSEGPLDSLVFAVEANAFGTYLALSDIQISEEIATYSMERNRLEVRLPQALEPGCAVDVDLRFDLAVPRINAGITAFKGYFGYSERQINLSLWLPTVAPYLSERWLLNEPQAIGEQIVLEQADWDLTLNLSGAPSDIKIAVPGVVEKTGDNQWHIVLRAARDLSLSISPVYRLLSQRATTGTVVELYTMPDAVRDGRDGGEHALREAVRAVEQFESLFGLYPYGRLLIVQGDFPDGMEFSALVFVSTSWFANFEGGADNYLTLITVHEVSHQWWYARVGNDAALAPWLDEALSTYSEYIFYEEFYPELKNWWWSFRVGWYNPQGNVDSTVYEFEDGRAYINAVYLRGVQMLHNLRETLGTNAFFDLLRRYAQAGDGKIATPELFWSLLDESQYRTSADTRTRFLSQPEVLPWLEEGSVSP